MLNATYRAFSKERKGCCLLLCLLTTVQCCSSQDSHSFHVQVVASQKLIGDWHSIGAGLVKKACPVI